MEKQITSSAWDSGAQQAARLHAPSLQGEIDYHLRYTIGKRLEDCEPDDYFQAIARTLRAPILDALWETEDRYRKASAKRMYYLSLEFLIGSSLRGNLTNLNLYDACEKALSGRDLALSDVLAVEPDPSLGNGGLGRLAACFLDSLASLGMPGYGYGINYEFGLFKQEIRNGEQVETPDNWFADQSPWLIDRPSEACEIPVYGRMETESEAAWNVHPAWVECRYILGSAHDMPIVGPGGRTVNVLRLYSARASKEFDMSIFNSGDYVRAIEQKISSEKISKVLYPSDAVASGRELRLLQEYFLVACSVRNIMFHFLRDHATIDELPEKVAVQMNDTHPALTVAELMRYLVDEHQMPWEKAWVMTQAVCGYTNHTLMAEALEKWPVALLERVIPRHLQIILRINEELLETVRAKWPADEGRVSRMSLIEEGGEQHVRMAHLAIVGSHAINGVSKLHTQLVKESLVPDFAQLWPERFHNKTNGVNHRRWLLQINPALAALITRQMGDGWMEHPMRLQEFAAHSASASVQAEFLELKHGAKLNLAALIQDKTGLVVNSAALFDVQIKRIHEYKRQLLNVLSIIDHYLALAEDGQAPAVPVVWIIAGKAAPGYYIAKLIIKLINNVSRLLAENVRARDVLACIFLPDYKVSLAEQIIPAADLSEQISTAGMEASGTGNMKLSMNGALTIGTLDGANIEIREAVGAENMYTFGLTADQVRQHQRERSYDSMAFYGGKPRIQRVVDFLSSPQLCFQEPGLFEPLRRLLMEGGDPYFHLADLEAYLQTQQQVATEYQNKALWADKAIKNIAGMGYFSSDRAVSEYAAETWKIESCLD